MNDRATAVARPVQPALPGEKGTGWFGALAVLVALASALTTFLVLGGMTSVLPTHDVVVWLLLFNGGVVLTLIAVVAFEARRVMRARRARAAAAGLHMRFVSLFGLVATLPAVFVAVVAIITLERGLDPWFTGSLRDLMGQTVEIAQAYRAGQCQAVARETQLMAADLNRAKPILDADRRLFREFMASRAAFLGFPSAMLLEADGRVVERVDPKPIDNLVMPTPGDLSEANTQDAICLVPREGNLLRAVLKLSAHDGRVLFVVRPVDIRSLSFPALAEAGVTYYQILEQKKFGIQVAFASMFAVVALIVLLSASWFGLRFANRFVDPIRRLIHATDQVATGNFYVQVPVRPREGDLAHLGQTFNKMTSELRRQHDGLTAASETLDRRRRFTEAVLAGVSAGVIGVDAAGIVTIVNPSAETVLDAERDALLGRAIAEVLPEIAPLVEEARAGRQRQQQVVVQRRGRERTVNVRVTTEQATAADKGFVITLDDITDLIAAQRTSAWADVARRIAHEIKNPLTPIQLSAERIRRKYGKVITTDRDIFDQCTDTIVRQVDDIKRMVDEFSSFARMPKPVMEREDIVTTVRQVAFMMRVAHPDITIRERLPDRPIEIAFDRRLLSQAVQNIVKNGTEAIEAVPAGERGEAPWIEVALEDEPSEVVVTITDTGKGFPREGRQRLLEPYMTTREGGTGLGLPIVAKILEEHGGGIELADNPEGRGGRVRLRIAKNNEVSEPAATPRRAAGARLHRTGA